MHTYKKNLSVFLIFFTLLASSLSAAPANEVKEYTLENGMKIYLLEDSSDAQVHIEYTCRAGFSSQTQTTCGFFKLYSRIINKIYPSFSFSDVQCNSDSSRYIINVAPQQTEAVLETMAQTFFAPNFSDDIISSELAELKSEVTENADTLSTYINAAIDSRVFSDAPWKNDSGIYPPLFKKTTTKTARNILNDISLRWYIPQNSALFIYGNINSERILITLRQTFGRFYSNYQTPVEKPCVPINKQRKYVFHNSEISSELTQVVVQYTMLNLEECDLLAAALNNNGSTFKEKVLSVQELNIPGAEYIDVSSAHKRDNSRLIIQTLMQPPENKKFNITSLQQALAFLQQIYSIPDYLSDLDLQFAKKQIELNLKNITSAPEYLMQNLSAYWAFENFVQQIEDENSVYESELVNSMLSQLNRINSLEVQKLNLKLQSENPFVFVIINSKDYKNNQKAFKEAGYEEINENNSSWYVQAMFKEIRDQLKPDSQVQFSSRSNTNDNSYYQKNLSQIIKEELPNGIKIISKQNPNSTEISLLLSVKGGKLNSANDNGLEEVMINLLAGIIEKEIHKKQYEGLVTGYPQISTKTDISTSSVLIEFDKLDEAAICEAIANSIIYGEIAPAAADKAVSSKQYRKRLENGSAVNQMYAAAIKNLYGKTDFSKIFETEKDVLEKTDYTSILSAYPSLLDAGRYTVIITGDFDDEMLPALKSSLSLFSNNKQQLNIPEPLPEITKSKNLNVKIRHTFLTDIPAEKAGPQPAVLIPTTEFLDPVMFITKAPEAGTKEAALFNAILNYIGIELQKEINRNKRFKESKVSVQLPASRLNFGTITIQNVSHTKETDSVYKKVIRDIQNQLSDASTREKTVQNIQNYWILLQMGESSSNSGTARLLQKGFELLPEECKPEYYLEEYNYIQNANAQDFMDIIPDKTNLRVYSTDGKE